MNVLAMFILALILWVLPSLIGLRRRRDDLSPAARLLLDFARSRGLLKPNDEKRVKRELHEAKEARA